MLLPPNNIAFTKSTSPPFLEWQAPLLSPLGEDWLGATYWSVLEWNGIKLTFIHNFSAIIL